MVAGSITQPAYTVASFLFSVVTTIQIHGIHKHVAALRSVTYPPSSPPYYSVDTGRSPASFVYCVVQADLADF